MRVDPTTLHYNLGRFLRLRLAIAKQTVYTMALKMGVRPSFVLMVISGLRMPRLADLELVCKALDYQASDALRCAWVLSDSQLALEGK